MMPLLFALAIQAAAAPSAAAPVLGPIGRQEMPATGCAAYLWSGTEPHQLTAMVAADAGLLRMVLDGNPVALPRTTATGAVAHGLAASTVYAVGDVTATLDATIVDREGLTSGAAVPDAVLRVERTGHDSVVVPLSGLMGCR